MKMLKTCIQLASILTIALIAFVIYSYLCLIPDISLLTNQNTHIKIIGEPFYRDADDTCVFEEIPHQLVYAFIAAEDEDFYKHYGVNISSLMRATKKFVTTGKKRDGGSTITMQVARNFFLHKRKTFWRKYREILVAIKLERNLNKNEILTLYLNKIYFGHNAYGIKEAAAIYYDQSLDQLSLAQMAMLATLPKAPSRVNPISTPQIALERRNTLLKKMFSLGFISLAAYQHALSEPLTAVR